MVNFFLSNPLGGLIVIILLVIALIVAIGTRQTPSIIVQPNTQLADSEPEEKWIFHWWAWPFGDFRRKATKKVDPDQKKEPATEVTEETPAEPIPGKDSTEPNPRQAERARIKESKPEQKKPKQVQRPRQAQRK